MKLNIKPLRDMHRNCYEDLIVSVLNWLGKEYEPIFSQTWGFHFDSKKKDIGLGLDAGITSIEEMTKKYTGIEIKWVPYKMDKEIFFTELKNGNPIFIKTNRYYCPWSDVYKEKKSQHYCLALGFNESGALYCMDPFYSVECALLEDEDLKYGCTEIGLIENRNDNVDFNWKTILFDMTEKMKENNVFIEMRDFADKIEKLGRLDIRNIVNEEPWLSPIFMKLRLIANGRKLAANTLSYLIERYNLDIRQQLVEDITECGNQWSLVHSILMRNSYLKEIDQKGLLVCKEKICNLSIKESQLIECLTYFLKYGQMQENSLKEKNVSKLNIDRKILLDTTQLNNNKAFYMELNHVKNTMSKQEHFILVNSQKELSGYISNYEQSPYDNMICEGQIINVNHLMCQSIWLEGFSDFSTAIGNLQVIYSTGEIYEVQLEMPNWIFSECHFDEKIEIGKAGRKYEGKNYVLNHVANLYKIKIKVNKEKEIVKIQLPICENLHLITVYLEIDEKGVIST